MAGSYLLALLQAYGKTPIVTAELIRGDATWRYALRRRDFERGGQIWRGSALDFNELNYSDEIRKDDFTLLNLSKEDVDYTDLTAESDEPLKLILRRGFIETDEMIIAYRGQLSSTIPHKATVDLVFSSWSRALSRRASGVVAMRQCPWRVYSPASPGNPGCGLDIEDHMQAGTVTAFSGGVLEIAEAASHPDGWFTGGYIRYAGDMRMIVKHVGDELTLAGPFNSLALAVAGAGSAAVEIAPGCDKAGTTCRDKFDNIEHNGSYPLMSDNPFTTRMN